MLNNEIKNYISIISIAIKILAIVLLIWALVIGIIPSLIGYPELLILVGTIWVILFIVISYIIYSDIKRLKKGG